MKVAAIAHADRVNPRLDAIRLRQARPPVALQRVAQDRVALLVGVADPLDPQGGVAHPAASIMSPERRARLRSPQIPIAKAKAKRKKKA